MAAAVKDAQVRKLMEEMSKHGQVGLAALRSGMDRKTARKYLDAGQVPSQMKQPRTWRTRENPFAADWPYVTEMLEDAPEIETTVLFEHLCDVFPGRYQEGQLRTLQRHVRMWRAAAGPEKEVFFAQEHRPGEAAQTDFTWLNELGIAVSGQELTLLLCHVVLPYSNWEWATTCRSESMMAIRRGVQAALFELGRVPKYHQTDNSTAATHRPSEGKRVFNDDYLALMRHLGMEPRTIALGEKQQNGDVESLHRALKRRLEQHLKLRQSRDFDSVEAFETWVQGILRRVNLRRTERLREELLVMRPLEVQRLREHDEETAVVSKQSTIRIRHNAYSVPSRLIDETVTVRVYEDRLEVYYAGALQMSCERLVGRFGHRINYRHVIWSLVRKPGAFPRYRYREDLFPSLCFRRAYDALCAAHCERTADIEYLRVLHLAASTMEADVEAALVLLLDSGAVPTAHAVRGLVAPEQPALPHLEAPAVDLSQYDELLASVEAAG